MSSTPASAVRMTRTGRRVVPTPAAAAAAADKAASDKEKEAKTTPTSSPVAHPVTTPVAKSVAEKGVVPPPSRMSSRMAAAAKFVKPDGNFNLFLLHIGTVAYCVGLTVIMEYL